MRWLLGLLLVCAASACSQRSERRRDDLSQLAGDYERPRKNVLGEIEYAKLYLAQDGVTGENLPFHESLAYQEVICSSPKRCRIRAIMCVLTVEARDDGTLLVSTDPACQRLAGVWYTQEQSTKMALELMSARPGAAIAAPSSPATPDAADLPSALPTAGPNVQACMRSCQAQQSACASDCSKAPVSSSSSRAPSSPAPSFGARTCKDACAEKALGCLQACP